MIGSLLSLPRVVSDWVSSIASTEDQLDEVGEGMPIEPDGIHELEDPQSTKRAGLRRAVAAVGGDARSFRGLRDRRADIDSNTGLAADPLYFAPDVDLLGQRLFAVHATDFFPDGGRIQARVYLRESQAYYGTEDPPILRCCVHWALGGVVPAHPGGMATLSDYTWDKKTLLLWLRCYSCSNNW